MKLRHFVLPGIALFLFIYYMRPAHDPGLPPKPLAVAVAQPESVRITQFYAAPHQVGRGDKSLLCYGVENAKAVRLSPAVEDVWPALVRCFDVVPVRTTRYTLTAEDAEGKAVSQSTVVEVGAPRTKLVDISINKIEVNKGELVTLCFKAQNATRYEIGHMKPIAIPPTPARGCFADRPQKTTTYELKVSGPGGDDSEKVTVKVR